MKSNTPIKKTHRFFLSEMLLASESIDRFGREMNFRQRFRIIVQPDKIGVLDIGDVDSRADFSSMIFEKILDVTGFLLDRRTKKGKRRTVV